MKHRQHLKARRIKPSTRVDERWAAVISRNAEFDGKFYYSVSTTGVYCRPSCPSRRAKRSNVLFHDTAAAAETGGFRPCKRCRPNEPPLEFVHAKKILEACRHIENAEEAPSLADLASLAGMSPFYFHRIFKSAVGLTPKAYAMAQRQKQVRHALWNKKSITAAIHEAGYNSGGRFYSSSSKALGMTPSDFRSGGAKAIIHFAVGECSLGAILIAASVKGVCAILLGDDPDALLKELQDRFPKSQLIGGDEGFEALAGRVIAYVEDPAKKSSLPLDIRGTAFQHQVWQALRDIPAGSAVSYADVAKTIGRPGSARAVAGACAANSIAVVVPCHRVVRSDGSLSGYRWGIDRKRELLRREGEH